MERTGIMDSSAASNKVLFSVGLGLGVTVISGAIACWYYHKYLKRDVMPQKWRRVGTLEQISMFPVKSCAPLDLLPEDELFCEILGLKFHGIHDRSLMIVTDKYEMVTARAYPKLVLVKPKLKEETKLVLSAPNMETLELNFATLVEEAPGKDVRTNVWGVDIDVMLCGEKYDRWFSRYLLGTDSGMHLAYYPYPKPVRKINPEKAKEPFITRDDTGRFCDATSYMMINLASVAELNTRVPRPVDALQFRGNFQLKMDSDEPYAEDHWQWVRIGDGAIFRVVSKCARCIFPNINPKTAERDPDGEPLKTLKSYRKSEKYPGPLMGIHLGIRQPGTIKTNDIVYVESLES